MILEFIKTFKVIKLTQTSPNPLSIASLSLPTFKSQIIFTPYSKTVGNPLHLTKETSPFMPLCYDLSSNFKVLAN